MNLEQFWPILAGFLLTVCLMPVLIPVLHKLKFGQQVRKEGIQAHLKKQGTPTMGGIGFLTAVLITSVVFGFVFKADWALLLPILLLTAAFALIGFADDYLKVVKKQSEGFKAWQKFLCQFVVTIGFARYCFFSEKIGTSVILPFAGGREWDMKWLYIPFVFLAVMGTDNGTNFTDGLDGLLSSVTIVVSFFLFAVSAGRSGAVSIVSGAFAGALMGYLIFNAYPAKVFMGDTGSLAIGAFVSASAIVLRMGWFILIFGLLYLIEVVSVILQVGYFKLTHGKRLFKMAPIHHHFEKCGWSETRIVAAFTIFTAFMCLIAWLAQ